MNIPGIFMYKLFNKLSYFIWELKTRMDINYSRYLSTEKNEKKPPPPTTTPRNLIWISNKTRRLNRISEHIRIITLLTKEHRTYAPSVCCLNITASYSTHTHTTNHRFAARMAEQRNENEPNIQIHAFYFRKCAISCICSDLFRIQKNAAEFSINGDFEKICSIVCGEI